MNRNDFLNMIGSRIPVSRTLLGEVYELVDLFPYCQSAHLLLLKGLKDNDDIKFEKQLRSSAVHIADREVLYYLLQSEKSLIVDNNSENTDNPPETTLPAGLPTEQQQTVIESALNSELLISEIERVSGIIVTQDNDVDSSAELHSIIMPDNSGAEDSENIFDLIDGPDQSDDEKIFFMDPGFSVPEKTDLLELDWWAEINTRIL